MATAPDRKQRILRWPEVSELTGFRSKCHVENMEKRGSFPHSVRIGSRAKGWLISEVEDWLNERIAERDRKVLGEAAS